MYTPNIHLLTEQFIPRTEGLVNTFCTMREKKTIKKQQKKQTW